MDDEASQQEAQKRYLRFHRWRERKSPSFPLGRCGAYRIDGRTYRMTACHLRALHEGPCALRALPQSVQGIDTILERREEIKHE